jgi:hypothetical protein
LLGCDITRWGRNERVAACVMRGRRARWTNWPDQLRGNCTCRSLAPADRMLCRRHGPSRRLTDPSTQPFTPDI